LPVWTYRIRDVVLEKRVLLPHLQNTVQVAYHVTGAPKNLRLELRPAFNFRHHESPVSTALATPYRVTTFDHRYEIASADAQFPALRMKMCNSDAEFTVSATKIHQLVYRTEQVRGYSYEGDLWSPGFFQVNLRGDCSATLVGSTEPWDTLEALAPEEAATSESERRARLLNQAEPSAREGFAAELVFAADQFVITPAGRTEEAARARAAGDEVRTVIAGYHWFTDWGRDTMISLEGLTLATGRWMEAGYILRTFSHYVSDGLIPNMFPDGEKQGLYHTADATLWFFHAVQRYVAQTDDRTTLKLLLPTFVDILEHHLRGTKFNIRVDAADDLLAEGEEGYQLTWMDAKMGDWVVTPRRGKAVELNALWYNALRLTAAWLRETGEPERAAKYDQHADRTRASFNQRFWNADAGCLFDVVDCNGQSGTNDPSIRPNQLFAISIDHPVLDEDRWRSVLDVCERELLTTVGLRSLAPGDADYKPIYSGDLRSRDGAYHQGTVWAWLIGPFVDAWLKVNPGKPQDARRFLEGFEHHLDEAGIGTISEVFDAREPHHPGGCIAQAWSIAEVLRCWLKTV
jgi:predicted glycogen debranching enzyme